MCCCINAIGNSLPSVYIFPRVHFKSYILEDALLESLDLTYPHGCMTGDLFVEAIYQFIKFMKVNKSNLGVLLVVNYISNVSIDAINMAKEYDLHLRISPPSCSYKLQPHDVRSVWPIHTLLLFPLRFVNVIKSWKFSLNL